MTTGTKLPKDSSTPFGDPTPLKFSTNQLTQTDWEFQITSKSLKIQLTWEPSNKD